jgi:putative Mn2+ efflux pump MntP
MWGGTMEMGTILLAVVMGIDAFTLGMGVAFKGIRLRWVMALSLMVALFHTMMPLAGMLAGHFLGTMLGTAAGFVGGGLFVLLGTHMIIHALWGKRDLIWNPFSLWGMVVFSLGVSLDSFSVGISLGLFAEHVIKTILIFGLAGGIAAYTGLLIGKHIAGWLGKYGEIIGGTILLLWGLRFIL